MNDQSMTSNGWRLNSPLGYASIVLVAVVLLYFSRQSDVDKIAVTSLDLSCRGCSVVLLNIELLRADHVGLISGKSTTPNIDAFFANSIVFKDVMAPAGETFVSNTSVLTMTDPFLNGIRPGSIDKFEGLSDKKRAELLAQSVKAPTIAQILQKNGYHTINVNQGGRAGAGAFLDRGFKDYSQYSSKVLFEDLVDKVIEKLDNLATPGFLLFRPTFLHNWQYRQPISSVFDSIDGIKKNQYQYLSPSGTRKQGIHVKRNRKLGPEIGQQQEYAIYRRQLLYGDNELQRIFTFLLERGLGDTIVVLYANHGSSLGDNEKFEHGTSYQSNVHVPILIRHPKLERPIIIDETVSLMDLMPTLLGMLGINYDGMSAKQDLFSEILGTNFDRKIFFGRNAWDEYVRQDNWKLVIQYGRFKALYDLNKDPNENIDLISKNRDMAQTLESRLLAHKLRFSN